MDSREILFLIGFLILGIAPIFAKHLVTGAMELIMMLGMILSISAAFSKSS